MKAGTQLGKVTMLVTAIVRYLTCLDCLPVSHQTLPILLYISVIWFNCMVTIVLDFAPKFLVFLLFVTKTFYLALVIGMLSMA